MLARSALLRYREALETIGEIRNDFIRVIPLVGKELAAEYGDKSPTVRSRMVSLCAPRLSP